MATACVGETDVSTSTQGVLEDNKIVSNKIVSNRIELNKIVSNKIVSNSISNNRYEIAANELISTADGREVLSYVVSCAIPADVTLVAQHEGVTYEFPGDIGLSPRWIGRALHETEQRWVSACMISRVNRFGIPVAISIRGPHSSLKVTEIEAHDYSLEEGAFYGNIFTPLEEPIIWNACRGRAEVSNESGDLDLRDCAEPDPENPGFTLCGFVYAGDCSDWEAPVNDYACRNFRPGVTQPLAGAVDVLASHAYHGGFYEQCHDAPGAGSWPDAERYPEVITVFVAPQS